MWDKHKGKIIVGLIILSFFAVKFGYVDKGDIRILVKDLAEIVKQFKEYLVSLFK